jgi:RNA polymerase sigma-70 factor (ECF subfamily)
MTPRPDRERALKALMMASLGGDGAAHRRFLTEVGALLRGYFRARLRGSHDVEDLVQETLIAIHTRRDSYDPAYPVTAWIYAIGRYRMIDHLRRMKRRGIAVQVEDLENELAAPDAADAGTAARDVARLLDGLPEKQRDAIRMTKLEDLTIKEVAARTGWSESDIKVSVHRGLKALGRLMAKDERA